MTDNKPIVIGPNVAAVRLVGKQFCLFGAAMGLVGFIPAALEDLSTINRCTLLLGVGLAGCSAVVGLSAIRAANRGLPRLTLNDDLVRFEMLWGSRWASRSGLGRFIWSTHWMGALYRPELKKQYVRAIFLGQNADKTTLSRGGILIGIKCLDADPDTLLLMLNREPTKVPAA